MDTLRIKTSVDLTGLQSGMPQAATLVEQATQRMGAAFDRARAASERPRDSFGRFTTALVENHKAADGVVDSQKRVQESMMVSFLKAQILADGLRQLISFAKEYTSGAAQYAARTETLAIVTDQLSKVNNLGVGAVRAQAQEIQKLGITTQESLSVVNKMIFAQLDLKKSTDLARLAQNAAVIAGVNSSQALGGILHGIVTRQTDVLRTYGITVDFETAYLKAARDRGRGLTGVEKQQVALQEVLKQGVKIAGAYEASMLTAGKQLTSLSRYTDEAKLAIGEGLVPALGRAVSLMTSLSKYAAENGENFSKMAVGVTAVGVGMAAFKMMPGPPAVKVGAGLVAGAATWAMGNPDAVAYHREQGESAISGLVRQREEINKKMKAAKSQAEAEALKSQYDAANEGINTVVQTVADNLAKTYIDRVKGSKDLKNVRTSEIMRDLQKEFTADLGNGVQITADQVFEAFKKRQNPDKSGALFNQEAYDKAIRAEELEQAKKWVVPIAEKKLQTQQKQSQLQVELAEQAAKHNARIQDTSTQAETTALLDIEQRRFEVEMAGAKRLNELKAQQAKLENKPLAADPGVDLETVRLEHEKRRLAIINDAEAAKIASAQSVAKANLQASQTAEEAKTEAIAHAERARVSMRYATALEEAEVLRNAENFDYDVKRKGLEDQLALAKEYPEKNKAEIIQLNGELAALAIQHQTKLNDIQADGERRSRDAKLRAAERDESFELAHAGRIYQIRRDAIERQLDDSKISAKKRIELLRQIEQQEYATAMAAASTSYQRASATSDPESIARAQAQIQEVADRYAATLARMEAETKKVTFNLKEQIGKMLDAVGDAFSSGFERWISGSQRFAGAMASAFRGMATQVIANLVRMAAQMAISAAQHKALAHKEVIIAAKTSAVHAFKSVMKALPFPANVIVAPIAAGGVFAGVVGLGSFEHGGVVPKTGIAMVHAGERVLTNEQTSRFERALESGGGQSGQAFHYHAAPGESPDSVTRNAEAFQRAMRDGRLRLA